jgi:hypothetical protein
LDPKLNKVRIRELDRAPAALARSSRRLPWRAWRGWAFPLAAAAAVALFVIPALLKHGDDTREYPTPGSTPTVASAQQLSPSVEHEIRWNTVDEGTVFVNGDTPMRSIRRERVDNVRWVDPDTHATMQMSVPNNEVVLVGMHAN